LASIHEGPTADRMTGPVRCTNPVSAATRSRRCPGLGHPAVRTGARSSPRGPGVEWRAQIGWPQSNDNRGVARDGSAIRRPSMAIKAEYIWVDGTEPTRKLRSKTKILSDSSPVEWGFDGSSTNQAEGHASDCILRPVFNCPDPIRGGKNLLVMCEVFDAEGK